ncbi:MAG: rhamnan synthesis F family protein [Deltaproteobacteria bacterium]|jgi:hypothetical protein|nr:rhamnan synthesis F family protein [Deltaproteobacteria bacterium]
MKLKYYIKFLLIKIMLLFGKKFIKFCTYIPKIKTIAYIIILKDNPLKETPELGTPLNYSEIKPMRLGDAGAGADAKARVVHDSGRNYLGRRVALLAHYDPDGMVDPYALYFAERLKKSGYLVVLCSQNEITMDENLRELFDAAIYRNGPGLDFTSWKKALGAFPSLFEAEELLLTNDSFFGPVGSLEPLYDAMNPVECDFWGVVENPMFRPHVQSFYIVLRKKAVTSKAFREFFDSVRSSAKRRISIRYETIFTQWLISGGLTGAVRFPLSCYVHPKYSNHIFSNGFLKTGQFPFIKRRMIIENPYAVLLQDLPDVLSGRGYPVSLMTNYARRIGKKLEINFEG